MYAMTCFCHIFETFVIRESSAKFPGYFYNISKIAFPSPEICIPAGRKHFPNWIKKKSRMDTVQNIPLSAVLSRMDDSRKSWNFISVFYSVRILAQFPQIGPHIHLLVL
jgi:hypothetical protein